MLFRPARCARGPSAAALRLVLEPTGEGARVRLLKSRGGARHAIELAWRKGDPS
jgi:hypothetical protein